MSIAYIDGPVQAAGASPLDPNTLPFLPIGDAPPLVPELGCNGHIGAPCAGVVLLDAIEPAVLAEALDAAPDPAVPIADFGGNRTLRSDYTGDHFDADIAADLKRRFAPIQHRLDAIPFHGAREDRAELTILRLAYSRNTEITAAFDPTSRNLVEYPLLGHAAASRQYLEELATLELLRRRHFTRTHLCDHCDSARLHAFEACPACGSADLLEAPIVHHYHCGWQEPEPRFVKDHALVCPKCRRELRHYGVDYDKPGSVMLCRSCQEANSEPAVRFACMDCAHITPAGDARTVNWYHYDLTDDGMQALRDGRIPRFDIGDHLDGHPRAFALRDFRLLATESIRVARRYQRPFTVAALSFANARALQQDHGPATADQGFRRAVDMISESLRDSDFIGIEGAHSIFIGLPETTEQDAQVLLDRLSAQIKKTAGIPIALAVATAEGDRAGTLLPQDIRP
jgi:hypothetical protein